MRLATVAFAFTILAALLVGVVSMNGATESVNEVMEGPANALADQNDEAVVVNFTVDCRTDRCDLTYDERIMVEFHARDDSGELDYVTWVSFYQDRGTDVKLSKDTDYVLKLKNNRLLGDESPVIGSFKPTRSGSVVLQPNGTDSTLRVYYGGE